MRWTNALAGLALFLMAGASRPVDPLPSWNNGLAPQAAFGNSTGDREMLEYAGSGSGAHLVMLVPHDDASGSS